MSRKRILIADDHVAMLDEVRALPTVNTKSSGRRKMVRLWSKRHPS